MTEQMMSQEECNAFVLENVLDTQGYSSEVECPGCGQPAEERHFDECLGGCINQVYSIDCHHCGHHECDQEYCPVCEANNYDGSNENYHKAGQWLMLFDQIEEWLQEGKTIPGLLWTELKHTLYSQSDVLSWVCTMSSLIPVTIDEVPKVVIAWHQRKMLDIRFKVRLDARIEQAKLNESF